MKKEIIRLLIYRLSKIINARNLVPQKSVSTGNYYPILPLPHQVKRRSAFIFTLLFVSQFAFAQFYLGPKIGGGIGTVSTPTIIELITPEIGYLPTFEFGISSEYMFSENFGIIAEATYRDKGFRIKKNMNINLLNAEIPVGVRIDTRIRYLDIPIMAKYAFGDGLVKGYIAAGPQIGYALNGRIKTKANILVDFNVINTPINLSNIGLERIDLGAVIAAGGEINLGGGKLFADVRYQQGFLDSFNVPVVDLNIKNHGFGFGVGYKFAL